MTSYEGCVCLWDVNKTIKIVNNQEHSKRVWSVVYNPAEPSMYASGSDDCTGKVLSHCPSLSSHSPSTVKLWCTSRPHSIFTIDANTNVCSVRVECHYLAYGSAGTSATNSLLLRYFSLRLCVLMWLVMIMVPTCSQEVRTILSMYTTSRSQSRC